MTRTRKAKSNISVWAMLAIIISASVNLCFSPYMAMASVGVEEARDGSPMLIDMPGADYLDLGRMETCRESDVDDAYKNEEVPQPINFSPSQSENDTSGALAPCCRNHDAITKIDTTKKQELGNSISYAVFFHYDQIELESAKNSFEIDLLDLPPPEAERIATVQKKE